MAHKAGFVNIIGSPNVGKSTLMNALVGERLSIITSKAQTTRDRILGIVNGEDFQIVYSDTPGVIQPGYKLHESMMKSVETAFKDADIMLFMTDVFETEAKVESILSKIQKTQNSAHCSKNFFFFVFFGFSIEFRFIMLIVWSPP